MATNHFYDETAGHRIVVAAMGEGKPLLRAALLGAYVELISVMQRNVAASADAKIPLENVETHITRGDIMAIEPWEPDTITTALIKYGLLTEPDQHGHYRLIPHAKLTHWEQPETIYWRKLGRQDTRDPDLNRAVRYRDGDQCRCCHVLVKWGAPKTDPERGTLDHVDPRTPAEGNPEALAVTCGRCNGIRSDRPDADEIAPHQPVPEHPYYTKETAAWLRAAGYKLPGGKPMRATGKQWLLPRIEITARPAKKTDNPHPASDPAASGNTRNPETPQNGAQGTETPQHDERPRSQRDNAPKGQRPAPRADNASTESRSQFERNSHEVREPNSGAPPPDSRTKPPPKSTPLPRGAREGKVVNQGGAGHGSAPASATKPSPRKRSRRGKSSPHAQKGNP